MAKTDDSIDYALALELHQQLNSGITDFAIPSYNVGVTENAILPKNGKDNDYKPRTLIDRTLELIDPTPNILTLFMQFNTKYFWNKLLPVEVKWSPRMTSCAGVCTFHPWNRQCVISLSLPLLKLRPRKDLVETLLHEMIHGYLFLTNNNRDRDGHGPEFHKHMYRINEDAGTKISVYHNFHDEVRLYQQHWWRCNGVCQKRPPYFGMVRRAMNRKPGPSDFWFAEHQRTCGGQYIKVREPEKPPPKNKSKKGSNGQKKPNVIKTKDILDWFTKDNKSNNVATTQSNVPTPELSKTESVPYLNGQSTEVSTPKPQPSINTKGNTPKISGPWTTNMKNPTTSLTNLGNNTNNVQGSGVGSSNGVCPHLSKRPGPSTSNGSKGNTMKKPGGLSNKNSNNPSTGFTKLGNNTNNVHGWGVGGPNGASACPNSNRPTTSTEAPKFNCVGSLGGVGNGRSNLLDKFSSPRTPLSVIPKYSSSPIQGVPISLGHVNNITPARKRKSSGQDVTNVKQPKMGIENASNSVNCPVCNILVSLPMLNDHLDDCLIEDSDEKHNTPEPSSRSVSEPNDSFIKDSVIVIDSSDSMILDCSNDNASTSSNNTSLVETVSRKCPVCDTVIDPNVTLNDHLETCIGVVFDDESLGNSSWSNDDEMSEVDQTAENKFPCPICMELIEEELMNRHLDSCLSKDVIKKLSEE